MSERSGERRRRPLALFGPMTPPLWTARRFSMTVIKVQWAQRSLDGIDGHLSIPGRRSDVLVSQQLLDDGDVVALFEQMGGKAMAQGVDGDRLIQTRIQCCLSAGALD